MTQKFLLFLATATAVLLTAACAGTGDDDVTRVAFISSSEDITADGLRLASSAQHIRAATAEGLVRIDQTGAVVPAVAERWIVTEDGLSYIFRLRSSQWPDGTDLTAAGVRAELLRTIRLLDGTSLGIDLTIIDDIRAMTGRVVEIRLTKPMPQFLQLLAQPELGLRRSGQGVGPMQAQKTGSGVLLTVVPPERSGMPEIEGWEEAQRAVFVTAQTAQEATNAFEAGSVDAVFGGQIFDLPLADTGPLSSGTVRLDAVYGLFGLAVRQERGFLADADNRGALALAIDRETLLQPFNIGGWVPTTRIIPPDLPDEDVVPGERWADLSLETRQDRARARVSAWKSANGRRDLRISLAMPEGTGSDMLFAQLAADYAAVGVELIRAGPDQSADLILVDQIARYGDVRWFLNQFNCTVVDSLCSRQADALVKQASSETNPVVRLELFTDAERILLAENVFIPMGAPIRWSLIRGGVDGFEENRWGLHPLFPMALRPI